MERTDAIITQKPAYISYQCPYCHEDFQQDSLVFMTEQGLEWSEYPDWEYENLTCPKCKGEFKADFEFD